MTNLEMNPEIKEQWQPFLDWLYKHKQLSHKTWHPDYESIKLWEEYKKSKR